MMADHGNCLPTRSIADDTQRFPKTIYIAIDYQIILRITTRYPRTLNSLSSDNHSVDVVIYLNFGMVVDLLIESLLASWEFPDLHFKLPDLFLMINVLNLH